jgi:Na+/citrate or Na+/malate symporter
MVVTDIAEVMDIAVVLGVYQVDTVSYRATWDMMGRMAAGIIPLGRYSTSSYYSAIHASSEYTFFFL